MDKNMDISQALSILNAYKNKSNIIYDIGLIAFELSMLTKELKDTFSINQLLLFNKIESKYLVFFDENMKDVINFTLKSVKKSTK